MLQFNELIQNGLNFINESAFPQAVVQFSAALEIAPNSLAAIRHLTEAALNLGTSQQVIPHIHTCMQYHPTSILLHQLLGVVYQQNKQLPQAIEYYRAALNLLLTTQFKPSKPAPKANFDQSLYEATLWQTLHLFRQNNLRSFATSGTLLGLTRDKCLLPFDKDIDIGIDWGHMPQAIELLKQNGWHEHKGSYDLINPRCFIHANGVILDLCGYGVEQTSGQTISGLWMSGIPFEWNRVTVYPKIDLVDKQTEFGTVWHPEKPEEILQALYGEWQIKDANFDTIICAKNLRAFTLLTQCFAYSRICVLWQQHSWVKLKPLIEQVRRYHPADELFVKLEHQLHMELKDE
ncbi:LicD family protein [Catenovulum agarivorans]|uniref:LicD family protein n=1 Tax=Catenovulum agarivorans TaxID=1172192 RepID=UPI00035F1677|nr:LicD family protein [Catenovulum agarivorans]